MDLTFGLISQGMIFDEVVAEMLDHQGVSYRVVHFNDDSRIYPIVILPTYSEEAYSLAVKSCQSESGVIVVEKIISLNLILSLLKGSLGEDTDNFELVINKEEEKLLTVLKERLFGLNLPLVRKWYWPNSANACCVLTHDIDWFEYSPFHRQVLRQSANPTRMIRLAFDSLVRKKDFGWNVPETVSLEEERGFRSTFFFQTSYGSKDLMEQSVDILRKRSFEVALHGTEGSHRNSESLKNEMALFNKRVGFDPKGIRYHILKFEVPLSWEIEAAAGLKYDATFYYNHYFGFRAGICFPYRPFSDNSRFPILELPTGFMDWTSLHRGQSAREQLETIEKTRTLVEGFHGVFVSNFHNSYLNPNTFPGVYENFKELLAIAKAEQYWVATAEECASWWQLRTDTDLTPRLEAGEILCNSSNTGVLVERENGTSQMIAPSQTRP